MKKSLATVLSLTLAFALLLTGCQQNQTGDDDVVATLDDYVVTMDEYTFFYRIFQVNITTQAMYNGYGDEEMLEYWNTSQGDLLLKDMLAQEALTSAKEYGLLYNAALENGTVLDEGAAEASDAQVDELVENYGGEEAFVEMFHMPSDLMKTMYRRLDLVDKYLLELTDSIEISDDEIQQAYDENKDKYSMVTVRHVLITPDEEAEDQEQAQADALALAEDVLAQIQDGADIGALAAEYSHDPGSKDNNGEYTFGKGQMVQPFEEWAFSAQPGDQGIVETTYGYHVMEMIAHADLEAVKADVRSELANERSGQLQDEIVEPAYSDAWVHNQKLLDTLNVEEELLETIANNGGGATDAAADEAAAENSEEGAEDEAEEE